jgi:tetratricopeptide (TPR) repeat protein
MEKAVTHLRQVIENNPNHFDARVLLARALNTQRKQDEALEQVRHVVAEMPTHGPAQYVLGSLYSLRGQSELAIEHLKSAVEADPAGADAYVALSQEYSKLGQFGFADEILQTGLQRMPLSPDLRNSLAWLRATCPDPLYRNGREAVELALAVCTQTGYGNAGYVDTLAAAYAEAEDFEQAVKRQQEVVDTLTASGREPDAGFLERLALYRAGKKYRDVRDTGPPREPDTPKDPIPEQPGQPADPEP